MRKSIELLNIPIFSEENGCLSVFEFKDNALWPIERVFTVIASGGDIRGEHAHIKCEQALFCIRGQVLVRYSDGQKDDGEILLRPNGTGLLISPLIWASQEYLEDECVLMVLCSEKYDEDDYLK